MTIPSSIAKIAAACLAISFIATAQCASRLTIKMESEGISLSYRPSALTPSTFRDTTRLVPGYVVEASENLGEWSPIGKEIRGGIVDQIEARTLLFELQGNQRFIRLKANLNFSGLDLSGQDLSFADLRGSDLSDADLSFADLRGANLTGANLRGANLKGANLISANLKDASASDEAIEDAIQLLAEPIVDFPLEVADLAFGGAAGGGVSFGGAPRVGGNLGFAVGGANDVNNFRANIENDFLPLFTDVTYEGLFYDYFFDTGESEPCKELFCPSYAQAISQDPVSGTSEIYLAVGLNSGIKESDFQRKNLNLVIVLDVSGSMSSPFKQYYYDQFGRVVDLEGTEDRDKLKMEVANESVAALLKHLGTGDRIGIVTFNKTGRVIHPLTAVEDTDMEALHRKVMALNSGGGTAFSRGMELGTRLFEHDLEFDPGVTENRIIFLTDAMPNIGELSEDGLFGMIETNADLKIYSTVIGIGVDFNTELIEPILKNRGANYYSVHSPAQFIERMDDGFEFMVTPLVFDLQLTLSGDGYEIEKVYGSPEANEATGELMKVNTLFPSKRQDGETRGGLVLLKLKKQDGVDEISQNLTLGVTYENRLGEVNQTETTIVMANQQPDVYDNSGIRKGILLTRYANLLKNWISDERESYNIVSPVIPVVQEDWGIIIPEPRELGQWERRSVPLYVSNAYRDLFQEFLEYFENEAGGLEDETLDQEVEILKKLIGRQPELQN